MIPDLTYANGTLSIQHSVTRSKDLTPEHSPHLLQPAIQSLEINLHQTRQVGVERIWNNERVDRFGCGRELGRRRLKAGDRLVIFQGGGRGEGGAGHPISGILVINDHTDGQQVECVAEGPE